MTPTRWRRVQDIVTEALARSGPERAKYLDGACGTDLELRRQIEDLVQSYEEADSFLEDSVAATASEAFSECEPGKGERIGPYQITGVIGKGGMGSVYRASRIDDQFRQQVAIKVLHGGFSGSTEMLVRFRAERQILASLTHPNIGRLLDGGITSSCLPYLAMEYIEGTTIDLYSQNQSLTLRERLNLFRQVCAAIHYAHQNLIVHRDIKPTNVMVTNEGVAKLLDFGIAKLLQPEALGQTIAATRPAERLMTPEYASPEQICGGAITTATDIYGLGALLYELITSKRPFADANLTPANLERMVCEGPAMRPSNVVGRPGNAVADRISSDLDNIVMKAMHKEPERRYASAMALSEDIERYLQGFPISARIDSWTYRTRKFVWRHKLGPRQRHCLLRPRRPLALDFTFRPKEARTANQVSDFLVNVFEYSRPDRTQGRNNYARELLDFDAQRAIGPELADQPAVQSRLLDMLGTTYRN